MRLKLLLFFLLLSFLNEAQVQTKLERGIPEIEGLRSGAILNFINKAEEKRSRRRPEFKRSVDLRPALAASGTASSDCS